MTIYSENYENTAQQIIDHVGMSIVIGVPLGIGKPIGLLNALYKISENDPSIKLTIVTALTLARPVFSNDLEKRFAGPIVDRVLQDYEDPLYEKTRKLQKLPDNIRVIEFFFTPGNYLKNNYAQQNYVCSSYSNVIHDLEPYGINVLAQQVARATTDSSSYSLSCNTDLFHGVIRQLKQSETNGKKIAIIGEVNLKLPFMLGKDAIVTSEDFTHIVDTGYYKTLFSIPNEELSIQDHLIGFYASCLVKDDSCIQIGIGKLSNAVSSALIMRHRENKQYQDLLKKFAVHEKFGKILRSTGESGNFDKGLYASTEMLSDGYLHLYNEGVLKKQVYDHAGLQRLLNLQKINEIVTPELIDSLIENKIINLKLTMDDVAFLLDFGIFRPEIHYSSGSLILSSGESIAADLSNPSTKKKILDNCLGDKLKTGTIIHAAFFLGSAEFYKKLHNMPSSELQHIAMTSISRTNTVSWSQELSQLQRQHARFINSAMMITLGGAIISDTLENLQEVSGVGGQFDFVNMAHQLEGARSIIVCRSVRKHKNKLKSNIVWDFPSQTIPRYLRDIVVTEYGIADCRSKTDSEVIKSILSITDSRFQNDLLAKAKKCGKLPENYQIPVCFRNNTPEYVEFHMCSLVKKGLLKAYPFGTDLTDEEQTLQSALIFIKNHNKYSFIILLCRALLFFTNDNQYNPYLIRMNLQHPKNIKEHIYRKLIKYSLYKQMKYRLL